MESEQVCGRYRRLPVANPWHEGLIETVSSGPEADANDATVLQWRNEAGVAWSISVDPTDSAVLKTGEGNPYQSQCAQFVLRRAPDGTVIGFLFNTDFFVKEGKEMAVQRSGDGLKGYISMQVPRNEPGDKEYKPGFGYGVSFYVGVWPLIDNAMAGFQIGLPSTWIIPDNADFEVPLCPEGTLARTWAERGPYWRDVFQTIEGGVGYWCSTQFGQVQPKYRINGTPNGYNHEVSSPGFGFGSVKPLEGDQIGLAHLSNRLLIPPDGFTFAPTRCTGLLGNAWMALPLLEPISHSDGTSTGDHCWTLFLEADNFCGAVAFFVPSLWSVLAKGYPVIDRRGLDARPGEIRGGAMEVNTVPYFEGCANDGTLYSRVPRLSFPVDENGLTVLMRDVTVFPRESLYQPIQEGGGALPDAPFGLECIAYAWRPPVTPRGWKLGQGSAGSRQDGPQGGAPIEGLTEFVEPVTVRQGDSDAFALKWLAGSTEDGYASFPEYFRYSDDGARRVPVSNPPPETKLAEQKFEEHTNRGVYELPEAVRVEYTSTATTAGLGPHTRHLQDGSVLEYVWCRFVDQPSLRGVPWSATVREAMQVKVEEIHQRWTPESCALPRAAGPTELVELDPNQLVEPPVGFECGYVPVVLRQYRAPPPPSSPAPSSTLPTAPPAGFAMKMQASDEDTKESADLDDVMGRTSSYTEAITTSSRRSKSNLGAPESGMAAEFQESDPVEAPTHKRRRSAWPCCRSTNLEET